MWVTTPCSEAKWRLTIGNMGRIINWVWFTGLLRFPMVHYVSPWLTNCWVSREKETNWFGHGGPWGPLGEYCLLYGIGRILIIIGPPQKKRKVNIYKNYYNLHFYLFQVNYCKSLMLKCGSLFGCSKNKASWILMNIRCCQHHLPKSDVWHKNSVSAMKNTIPSHYTGWVIAINYGL